MRNLSSVRSATVCLLLGWTGFAVRASAENQPPLIDHAPVSVAVHGQNLVVRAHVTDDTAVQSVTLYYTASRDAAAFKVPMQNSGAGVYTAVLRPELFAGLTRMFYYLEAKDEEDGVSETPWHTVELRSLTAEASSTTPPPPAAPVVERSRSRWFWPTVAAGGVVLGGTGIALALRDDDNGSSGPPPTTNGVAYAGTYVGSATTCAQPPGGSLVCSQGAVTITIQTTGVVASDDLALGQHLESVLAGNSFVLTYSVNETNRVGQILYMGTVVGNRILGTIQGALNVDNGVETYSGNFTAVRQ